EGEDSKVIGGSTSTGDSGDEVDSMYAMSPAERARYHKAFSKLDKGARTGYLGTKEAAKVLAKSGLEKEKLGKVWSLADIDKDGALSRDEFAVAMHITTCAIIKHLPVPDHLPTTLGGRSRGVPNSKVARQE
ncbi:unnamed protein product, partial [Choristocarpus tenellus]